MRLFWKMKISECPEDWDTSELETSEDGEHFWVPAWVEERGKKETGVFHGVEQIRTRYVVCHYEELEETSAHLREVVE